MFRSKIVKTARYAAALAILFIFATWYNGAIFITGRDAAAHGYPFLVSVQRWNETTASWVHTASGILVHGKKVVTAARVCTAFRDYNDIVRCSLGRHNLEEEEQSTVNINVSSYHCHDKFSQSPCRHDICLLNLAEKISRFTPWMMRAPFSFAHGLPFPGNCRLPGWGSSMEHNETYSPILQEGHIVPLTPFECKTLDPEIFEFNWCAYGQEYPGPGDNGSPLICRAQSLWSNDQVVAMHSCGMPEIPGKKRLSYYLNLAYYRPFITADPVPNQCRID
ncbi:chymase-like isoform X1 [Paramacrobiotus metropolitanus]|uniref:chymase-like isoform X1 n=1 Tax=Paramacrobiotus metropolitanus TaxID=2943436 RepID=UPI002445C8D3|nr:chymase-like isoform X1 [Paramacrobiotus metropolitanus]